MHALGFRAQLVHNKQNSDGTAFDQVFLINEPHYNYLTPLVHEYAQPVIVEPGDELILKCYYSSNEGERFRNKTISWGDGANVREFFYAWTTLI
jgi:hypothetical protein